MAPYLLVVESDPDLQRQIADALREANYELSTEREGTWAQRSLSIRVPDGLVVNTRLSDGAGFKVASELRRDPEGAHVPIFFLSGGARGVSHDAEMRRRFAPATCLPAPVDPNSLLANLLRTLPPPVAPVRVRLPSPTTPPPADDEQAREGAAVEQHAPQLQAEPSSPVNISGSLERDSFAQVLRRLFVERRTGALLVVREKTKKIVYVEDGYPVAVRSNALRECLGQILLANRRISADVLKSSLQQMQREKRQQGEILVQMGVLSPHGLAEALAQQMEAKLLGLFAWRSGNFVFKEGWKTEAESVSLDRPTGALILEGVRLHYDDNQKDYVLALAAGKYITPTSDPWLRLQELSVDAKDTQFMSRADGTLTLEEIMNVPPVPRDRARTLMVSMLEAGVVEACDQPLADLPLAPLALPEGTGHPRWSRTELAAYMHGMRAQSHFEVIGVTVDVGGDEIESAYVQKAKLFHPDGFRGRSTVVRELVNQIFSRLTEARRTLTDPGLRKAYLARLERARSYGGGGPDAATAAEQVYYTGVGHLHERRYAEAEAAFRQATNLVPGQPSYHGALGWAIYRRAPTDRKALEAATSELEHAVGLAPDDPWVRVSLGRFLAETGKPQDAVAMLQSALRLDPLAHDIEEEIRRLTEDV